RARCARARSRSGRAPASRIRFEPVGQLCDRREDPFRHDARVLDLIRAELSRADEYGAHPVPLRAADVAFDVVADHPRELRIRVDCLERRGEVFGARLAENRRLDTGGELEPGHERAGVELWPVCGLPPAVLVQTEELGAGLELEECAIQVEVRE